MRSPPPVLRPRQDDRVTRNWKWMIPAASAVLIGGLLVFGWVLLKAMKSSDAYRLAVISAKNNRAVIEALGEPVREGFMFTGNISISGSSGHANLAIPIGGPRGKGTLYAKANKTAGRWRYEVLAVKLQSSGRSIYLSGSSDNVTEERTPPTQIESQ